MTVARPYLLFLGDAPDPLAIKTAMGVVDWRPDWCLGQLRLPSCGADAGLPDMGLAEAVAKGARTFVIGAVNPGGVLPEAWTAVILEALAAGLDVASGLHRRLETAPGVAEAAAAHGRALHNLRHADQTFAVGTGRKRTGKRLLTVGTDCAVGKKYTSLAMERAMREAGMNAEFVATGQTGVLIAGRGVALDAVGADFISGAAEWLSPDAPEDHWHVVEGQGSLFHPAFAGVTAGLLHGSQPDAVIVCHEPTRRTMRNSPYPIARIEDVIDLTLRLGRLTNPHIAIAGVAVNTLALDDAAARACVDAIAQAHALPATDPIRFGCAPFVEALQARAWGPPADATATPPSATPPSAIPLGDGR